MPLLNAHHLSMQFDNGDWLFRDLSFTLTNRRTALIGRNGVGKSILAAIAAGHKRPSSGQVSNTGTIQFFQQLPPNPEATIAQYLGVDQALAALAAIESGHCEAHWFEQLADRWHIREEVQQLLSKLQLPCTPTTKIGQLSGGQQTKLKLGHCFASHADLLILDEPSNHLDADNTEWLRQKIKAYEGHILLISHDKYLLDEMHEFWSLSHLGLAQFQGSFAHYLTYQQQAQAAIETQLNSLQQQEKRQRERIQRAHEQAQQRQAKGQQLRRTGSQPKVLMDAKKDRSGQKAKGRALQENRQLTALTEKKSLLRQRQEDSEQQRLYLNGARNPQRRKRLVNLTECRLPWGCPLPINLQLYAGDRLHLSGNNGTGKSTLLHILRQQQTTRSGDVQVTAPLVYLDQHFSLLALNETVASNLKNQCPQLSDSDVRTRLAGVGFKADRADQPVAHLSGGERLKVALLCVGSQEDEALLLLDEPDNHLDLDSKQLLAEALKAFNGAFILVSHDQHFVAACKTNQQLYLQAPG